MPTIITDTGVKHPNTDAEMTQIKNKNIYEAIRQKLWNKDLYETNMNKIYNIIWVRSTSN